MCIMKLFQRILARIMDIISIITEITSSLLLQISHTSDATIVNVSLSLIPSVQLGILDKLIIPRADIRTIRILIY